MSYNIFARIHNSGRWLCFCFAALGAQALPAQTTPDGEPTRILFFGDSLTAGYGIDPSLAYPALVQAKIYQAGIEAKVQVGAVSGDTSAGGLRRVDWMLRQPVDIFVLALGANDGLRGTDPATTERNLQAILGRVKAKYPEAQLVVAGMRLPPSMGTDYTNAFAKIFPRLAKKNEAALIPFLLENVGGVVALNLPDRIHPNAKGHAVVAKNVWSVLGPLLQQSGVDNESREPGCGMAEKWKEEK